MKTNFLLCIAVILSTTLCCAQNSNFIWGKRIGGIGDDKPTSMTTDPSGNIYTTGKFNDTVDFDPGNGVYNLNSATGINVVFISKLDPYGNFVWANKIGNGNDCDIKFITTDAIGNIYFTGSYSGSVDFDPGSGVFLLSTNATTHAFVCKLNSNGNFIWAKDLTSTNTCTGKGITVDANFNIHTVGDFNGWVDFDPSAAVYYVNAINTEMFISKMDSAGNFIWAKATQASNVGTNGNAIAVDAAQNVYTTGSFSGSVDFDPNNGLNTAVSVNMGDIFLHKLNSNGDFLWVKTMGGTQVDLGKAIKLDNNSNIYITGNFTSSAVDFDPGPNSYFLGGQGSPNIFICRYDANGNLIWGRTMQSNGGMDISGVDIEVDNNLNVYTTGYFSSCGDFDPSIGGIATMCPTGIKDNFISKLDSLGNYVWAKRIGGSGDALATSLELNDMNDVYVVGYFNQACDVDPGINTLNYITLGSNDIHIVKLGTNPTNNIEPRTAKPFVVYPNPSNGNFEIILDRELENLLELTIYDPYGRVVQTSNDFPSGKELFVNISSQPNGLYLLVLKNEKGLFKQSLLKYE